MKRMEINKVPATTPFLEKLSIGGIVQLLVSSSVVSEPG